MEDHGDCSIFFNLKMGGGKKQTEKHCFISFFWILVCWPFAL